MAHLQKDVDGKLQRDEDTGHLVLALRCSDCWPGDQSDAVVTVAGTCDATCLDAAGTYAFLSKSIYGCDPGYLGYQWVWRYISEVPNIWLLIIACCPSPDIDRWSIRIERKPITWAFVDSDDVVCERGTGFLSGSYDLPGVLPGQETFDCRGCTATVTLGGP